MIFQSSWSYLSQNSSCYNFVQKCLLIGINNIATGWILLNDWYILCPMRFGQKINTVGEEMIDNFLKQDEC